MCLGRASGTPPNSADGRDSNLRLRGICCGRLLPDMEPLDASEHTVLLRLPSILAHFSTCSRFLGGSSRITVIVVRKPHIWRQDALAFWPLQLHGLGRSCDLVFACTVAERSSATETIPLIYYVFWYTLCAPCASFWHWYWHWWLGWRWLILELQPRIGRAHQIGGRQYPLHALGHPARSTLWSQLELVVWSVYRSPTTQRRRCHFDS